MNKEQILHMLEELARRRLVFHSEMDFQHELAWIIHQQGYSIRLELPVRGRGHRTEHLDIFARGARGGAIGIELKYKTKKETILVGGETFELAEHAATPLGRYDFWKDVSRLERFKRDEVIRRGFAIFLTNDSAYRHNASEQQTIGARFSMHGDRRVMGRLRWSRRPKKNSVGKKRMQNIQLRGTFTVEWRDYSNPPQGSGFKVLIVEV